MYKLIFAEGTNPARIYFYQNDVRASLRKTCDGRDEWWEKMKQMIGTSMYKDIIWYEYRGRAD